MTDPLLTLFDHLDRWRHLPAYQLERRADVFFSPYLPGLLAEHSGVEVHPRLIPELPIRRSLLRPGTSHASVKVDYVAFAKDRSKVFFVELKTDAASRRKGQDADLRRAVSVGFRPIVQGIVEISQASTARQKYGHLLHALASHGCVRLPEALDAHLWPAPQPAVADLLRQVEVTVGEGELEVEVWYVQPAPVTASSTSRPWRRTWSASRTRSASASRCPCGAGENPPEPHPPSDVLVGPVARGGSGVL